MSVIDCYLLRHGELVEKGILCGHTDIELSAKGVLQLETATSKLSDISHCISSPLKRCSIFAKSFCQQQKIPLSICADIQEFNFGDWDGKCYSTLWQEEIVDSDVSVGKFWQNPWKYSPPNGESMSDFTRRVDKFWQNLVEQEYGHKVLLLSHGGVIRYLLAKVLGFQLPSMNHMNNIDVPYGALIHIQIIIDENEKVWPKLML